MGHEILWPAPLTRWRSYIKRGTPQAWVLIYCTQTCSSNKRYGEHAKDPSYHLLCMCAHMLLWRESFQVAAGMFISESLCGCTKDIWHHQPAQLSALTFSKDKEREQKGDAFEMEQYTNDTFRQQQYTESTGAFRGKGLMCVCVCVWLLLIASSWTGEKLAARSPIILTLLWKWKSIPRLFLCYALTLFQKWVSTWLL